MTILNWLRKLFKRKWFDNPRKVRWFVWQIFMTGTLPYDASNETHYILFRHPLDCRIVGMEDWHGLRLSGRLMTETILN